MIGFLYVLARTLWPFLAIGGGCALTVGWLEWSWTSQTKRQRLRGREFKYPLFERER